MMTHRAPEDCRHITTARMREVREEKRGIEAGRQTDRGRWIDTHSDRQTSAQSFLQ